MTTAALESALVNAGHVWVSVIALHGDDVVELTERGCVQVVPCRWGGQTLENERVVSLRVYNAAPRARHFGVYAHAADRHPTVIGIMGTPLRLQHGDFVEFQRGRLALEHVAFDVFKAVADQRRPAPPPRRGWLSRWLRS